MRLPLIIFPTVVDEGSSEFIVDGAVVGSVGSGGYFGELALMYSGKMSSEQLVSCTFSLYI